MAAVVGVHGIWNYGYFSRSAGSLAAAREAIGLDWARWLAPGLGRQDVAIPAPMSVPVAYYADCLDRGVAQGPDDDPNLLPPLAQKFLVEWVQGLRDQSAPGGQAADIVAAGYPTWPVRQAADWLTQRFGDTARWLVTVLVSDLAVYFDPDQAHRRQAARHRVAEAIGLHRPRVLIAHSLGSVVAYEALCADPALRVELLVTLGSPLGMPRVVFDRLEPAPCHGRASRPPGAVRWTNIADVGDPVAVPAGGLQPCFDGVDTDATESIAMFDPHTAKSYLACAALGTTLAPYLYAHNSP